MQIKLNKEKFKAIEGSFLIMLEDHSSSASLKVIKNSLEECFPDYEFDIRITDPINNQSPLFVMSVYPELTTIDKIINAVLSNKNTDAIKKLWETNKKWTIEIDGKLFKKEVIDVNEKELTAMLLHEIGHIVYSTSLPNRISLIMRYEISKTTMQNKVMAKNNIFSTIMALPILDSCISDGKKTPSSIREEIKADSFVKKMGYTNELVSVLTKLSKNKQYPSGSTNDEKMAQVTNYSLQALDDFQKRKDNLVKKSLFSLKEGVESTVIKDVIDTFVEKVYEDNPESRMVEGRKTEFIHEKVDGLIEADLITEGFILPGRNLKRIDPNEISYIDIKIQDIKTIDDKMMIVSYIHNKLDLVEYYISILENPKTAKKYRIPHTLDQLQRTRQHLLNALDLAMKARLPEKYKGLLVAYPTGYEG